MKKGFTLIELLAVIVILAIIALIAIPIVINMMGSSKESADDRSAEFYLDAVEQSIIHKNLTEDFSSNTCEVQSDGNLKCDDDVLLEIEIDNTKPTSGTFTFDEGNILTYEFYVNDKYYSNATKSSCFTTTEISNNNITGLEITRYNCKDEITNVIIPNTIDGKTIISIGTGAFLNTKSTRPDKKLTSVVIPSNVISIGSGAFENNNLTSVTIPSSVTSIGSSAFYNNNLTSVIIPSSVIDIGDQAFIYNNLTNVTILGKDSLDDFNSFGSDVFDWDDGYSDSNIVFEP